MITLLVGLITLAIVVAVCVLFYFAAEAEAPVAALALCVLSIALVGTVAHSVGLVVRPWLAAVLVGAR